MHSPLPVLPAAPVGRGLPRIVLRDRAARVKGEGKPGLRERVLSSADAVGKISSSLAPLVNWASESRFARVILEKTLGVHRDRLLPPYAGESFLSWWERRGGATKPSATGAAKGSRRALRDLLLELQHARVSARAAVAVLEKNGCEVVVPRQRCCGMPYLESGDVDSARECRLENVSSLLPLVRAGYTVGRAGPDLQPDARARSTRFSSRTSRGGRFQTRRSISASILMRRHAEGRLSLDFQRSPGRVLYHVPCHLKVQDIGFKSQDLLKLIAGAEVATVEKCTGHDGTWSMKTEYFPLSMEIGKPVFREVQAQRPDTIATDCPLAGIQIRQATGRTAKHPVQILAEAYGLTYES